MGTDHASLIKIGLEMVKKIIELCEKLKDLPHPPQEYFLDRSIFSAIRDSKAK